jgi:hypothetical protein
MKLWRAHALANANLSLSLAAPEVDAHVPVAIHVLINVAILHYHDATISDP